MHDTEYRNVLNTATAFPMYELVNAINRFRAQIFRQLVYLQHYLLADFEKQRFRIASAGILLG